jgi:hypothetical protein
VEGDAVDFRTPVPHLPAYVDGLHGLVWIDSPSGERACSCHTKHNLALDSNLAKSKPYGRS